MGYYWTTDPSWFQVVLAGCTFGVNLIGAGIVGFYTWETVKLRKSAESERDRANRQFGMSISPELRIPESPLLVTSIEQDPTSVNVTFPYVLLKLKNEGPQVGIQPLALLRLDPKAEPDKCRVDYGPEGISSGESVDFIINKSMTASELKDQYKIRFRTQRLDLLQRHLQNQSPSLTVFCMDRLLQVHSFRWNVQPKGELDFAITSYADPNHPYLEGLSECD